jgi:hypothetical protein
MPERTAVSDGIETDAQATRRSKSTLYRIKTKESFPILEKACHCMIFLKQDKHEGGRNL